MERIELATLIFTLAISFVLIPDSHAYCWQAGWNPGFKVSYNIPYKVSVMILFKSPLQFVSLAS